MDNSPKSGYILAVAAFVLWGLAPIYFKAITEVPPFEVVAHRVIWSVITIGLILFFINKRFLKNIVQGIKTDYKALLSAALLLTVNWLVFIVAINSGKVLEASLGYYINPLLNVALGALILGERFSNYQKIAIALAVIGVAQEVIRFGQVPYVALILAFTFAIYGLIHKQTKTGGTEGLFIETTLMIPLAFSYLIYLFMKGNLTFYYGGSSISLLIMFVGLVTAIPLLLFIASSKRIRYSTLGLLQYIGPTIMGFIGYYLYKEGFPPGRLLTFSLVWIGLALTVFEVLRNRYYKKLGSTPQ